MTPADSIIVAVLASTDAIWTPCRDFERPIPGNLWLAQKQFAEAGIHWQSRGHTAQARKEAQRALEELAEQEFLTRTRPKKLRAILVRLTDASEIRARRLIGDTGLTAALESVREVERLAFPAGSAVAEALLADRWCKREFQIVQDLMLPAIIRGWVEANGCRSRSVRYSMTDAGREALRTFKDPHDDRLKTPKFTQEAGDLYDLVFREERDRLETNDPGDEIGLMPWPVCMPTCGTTAALVPASWGWPESMLNGQQPSDPERKGHRCECCSPTFRG